MKIISVIGYSGSGKTFLILNAIKILKQKFGLHCSVIKNIHEHRIDKKGKDSYKFMEAGANYCITKNKYDENTIFVKREIGFQEILEWIANGPLPTDVLFIEGFRNFSFPTILCIKNLDEIDHQLNNNVKMISGLILSKDSDFQIKNEIPFIDVSKDFSKFLKIFKIK